LPPNKLAFNAYYTKVGNKRQEHPHLLSPQRAAGYKDFSGNWGYIFDN